MRSSARRLRSSGRWLTLQTRGWAWTVAHARGAGSRAGPSTAGLRGQGVYRAPARAEGGGLGSWWVLASTPFRRCGRRPQRRNATEVGFPWAARATGPRVKLDMPGEGGVLSQGVRQPAHRGRRSPSRDPRAFLLLLASDHGLGAPPTRPRPH